MPPNQINHDLHTAGEISSPVEIELLDSYEEHIDEYREMDQSYIPMPLDGCYYDIEADDVRELDTEQLVIHETNIREVIGRLRTHPFLLVRPLHPGVMFSRTPHPPYQIIAKLENDQIQWQYLSEHPHSGNEEIVTRPGERVVPMSDFLEEYPELKTQFKQHFNHKFSIITLADVNSRRARALLYNIIAEFEMRLSGRIKAEHPNSTHLESEVGGTAQRKWNEAKNEGVDMHISEFLGTKDLVTATGLSQAGLQVLGFSSQGDAEDWAESLNDWRTRVMHPNKTLIRSEDDIVELYDILEKIEKVIERA